MKKHGPLLCVYLSATPIRAVSHSRGRCPHTLGLKQRTRGPVNIIHYLKGDLHMAKTIDDKITETKERIAQYENQVKRLLQKRKEAERKARTHRLIERGAILESMIDGAEAMSNEEIKALLQTALPSLPVDKTPETAPGAGA